MEIPNFPSNEDGSESVISLTNPICYLDLETTGVNPQVDRIVEITVLRVDPDGTTQQRTVRVNPGTSIPSGATAVHGITDEMVSGEPGFAQYAKGFYAFLGGCDLGGFGIKGFDVPLLRAEFLRAGIDFVIEGRRIVDALVLFHQREPRDLTAAYSRYCGKVLEDAHTSMKDVLAAKEILEAMVELYPDLGNTVEQLHSACHIKDASWIDDDGKLIVSENGPALGFGKHRGRPLKELADTDPGYLNWILTSDFTATVKDVVKEFVA